MKFSYRAFDKSGGEIADTIVAADVTDARDVLHRRGMFVAEITELGGGDSHHISVPARPGRGRLKNLAMFTRQLHVLLSAGTQVVPALNALERQMRDRNWRQTISSVRAKIEQGASLSEAMALFPGYFDSVYRSMVAAGEAGGILAEMLDRLANLARKRLQVQTNVRGALIYPCLLVTVAASVLTLLLVLVVPRFEGLFRSLDVPLPPTTAALIVVSELLCSYWWVGLLVVGLAAITMRAWLATPGGRRTRDGVLLRLPQIGQIAKSFSTARIVRLLGALLEGRVPVLEALKLTRNSTTNVHYTELVTDAENAVAHGEAISSTFARTNLISPSVYETTRSGEQSGQVGAMLLNLADFLDEENEVVLRSLTSILEPAILIVLGLLVGVVALSLFMPLFDLTSMMGVG